MRIGIDIDNTITNSTQTVKRYLIKYSDNPVLINNISNIMRGDYVSKESVAFYEKYSTFIGNDIKIKKNAREVIDSWHKQGHEIIIISARCDNYYKDAYNFSKKYLENNNIYFDKLYTHQIQKIDLCKKEKIDLMIDDAVDTINNLSKEGINGIVFNTSLNRELSTKAKRVNSWKELDNYFKNNFSL